MREKPRFELIMATVFENVHVTFLTENGEFKAPEVAATKIEVISEKYEATLNVYNG